jgi:hypothetical protein
VLCWVPKQVSAFLPVVGQRIPWLPSVHSPSMTTGCCGWELGGGKSIKRNHQPIITFFGQQVNDSAWRLSHHVLHLPTFHFHV